jgi:hypothetical protein
VGAVAYDSIAAWICAAVGGATQIPGELPVLPGGAVTVVVAGGRVPVAVEKVPSSAAVGFMAGLDGAAGATGAVVAAVGVDGAVGAAAGADGGVGGFVSKYFPQTYPVWSPTFTFQYP